MILSITIILSIATVFMAVHSGLFESRASSYAVAAGVVAFLVLALPAATFLITTFEGLLMFGYVAVLVGELYHRLFRTGKHRRQSEFIGDFRRWFGLRTNTFVFAVAW